MSFSAPFAGSGDTPSSANGPIGLTDLTNQLALGEFGFEVPPGDPDAIDAAAGQIDALGAGFNIQADELRKAIVVGGVAGGSWSGKASMAFVDFGGEMIRALGRNETACDSAAKALRGFGTELAHARSVTSKALAECRRFQNEMTKQQGLESQAGDDLQLADECLQVAQMSSDHSGLAHWQTQKDDAASRQHAAQTAAARAQSELEQAKHRGQDAWHTYQHQAQRYSERVTAAADDLSAVPMPSGSAPSPIAVSAAAGELAAALLAQAKGKLPKVDLSGAPTEKTLRTLLDYVTKHDHGRSLTPAEAQALFADIAAAQQRAKHHHEPWCDQAEDVVGSGADFLYDHSGSIAIGAGVVAELPIPYVDEVAKGVAFTFTLIQTEKDAAHGDYVGVVLDVASLGAGGSEFYYERQADGMAKTAAVATVMGHSLAGTLLLFGSVNLATRAAQFERAARAADMTSLGRSIVEDLADDGHKKR